MLRGVQRDSEEAKGVSGGLEFAAMIEIAESVGMRDTLGTIAEQCADLMGQTVAEIATGTAPKAGTNSNIHDLSPFLMSHAGRSEIEIISNGKDVTAKAEK